MQHTSWSDSKGKWMKLNKTEIWLVVSFWSCIKCSNCLSFFVQLTLKQCVSWREACLVLVFQQPLQTQTHTGQSYIFYLLSSAAGAKIFLVWCKPRYICPIHCLGFCIQQWKTVYCKVHIPDLQTCFLQCYIRNKHWRQQSMTLPLPVSEEMIVLKLPS